MSVRELSVRPRISATTSVKSGPTGPTDPGWAAAGLTRPTDQWTRPRGGRGRVLDASYIGTFSKLRLGLVLGCGSTQERGTSNGRARLELKGAKSAHRESARRTKRNLGTLVKPVLDLANEERPPNQRNSTRNENLPRARSRWRSSRGAQSESAWRAQSESAWCGSR